MSLIEFRANLFDQRTAVLTRVLAYLETLSPDDFQKQEVIDLLHSVDEALDAINEVSTAFNAYQETINDSCIPQIDLDFLDFLASRVTTLTRTSAKNFWPNEELIADAEWPNKVLIDERSNDVIDNMLNEVDEEEEENLLPPRPIGLTRQITTNHLRSDYNDGSDCWWNCPNDARTDDTLDEDDFPSFPVLTRQMSCDNELTDVVMESIESIIT